MTKRTPRQPRNSCKFDGCPELAAVGRKGWCSAHYQRWRKHGDPAGGEPSKREAWGTRGPYVGCWEWAGATNHGGYGVVNVTSHNTALVHRIVYSEIYGDLPELLRHRCDNPPCYNPAHLLPGTHAETLVTLWSEDAHPTAKPTFGHG